MRFGIKTGANEFFYLDEEKIKEWGIEKRFLKPVIKSPRECKKILIDPSDLKYKIFMCHEDKKDLKGTNALEYIKWGEEQKFNLRPTLLSKTAWWQIEFDVGEFLWWKSIGERYCFFWNREKIPVDQRNYYIKIKEQHKSEIKARDLVLSLNSTIDRLFIEANAREMTGSYTIIELPVEDVARKKFIFINFEKSDDLDKILHRNIVNINEEITMQDRRNLDSVIFDALNLTKGEREAVYEAVIDLVEARLKKAGSLDRQGIEEEEE